MLGTPRGSSGSQSASRSPQRWEAAGAGWELARPRAGNPPPVFGSPGGFSQACSGWGRLPAGHTPQYEHHLNEALRHCRYPRDVTAEILPARRLVPPSPARKERSPHACRRCPACRPPCRAPSLSRAGLHPPGLCAAQVLRDKPALGCDALSVLESFRPLGRGVPETGVGMAGMQIWAGGGCWERACLSGCSAEHGSSWAPRMRREGRAGGATQVPGRGAEGGHAART